MFVNFDFIRAVAIAMVVAAHLLVYHGNPVWAGIEFSMMGKLGVVFFFVHSAWVLMMSLERQIDTFGNSKVFRIFMIRRIFRIFPLSIVTVGLIALFDLPLLRCAQPLQNAELNGEQLIANFLLIENFYKAPDILGPLWSLAVEFQAYLFFPLAFVLLRKSGIAALGMVWAISAFLLVAVLPKINKINADWLTYYQIPDLFEWIPCFLAGMLAYKVSKTCEKTWSPLWLVAFIGVSIFGYILIWDFSKNYFVAIAMAILLTQVREIQNPTVVRVSKAFAKYSYSCYLGHYIALWLAFEKLQASPTLQWFAFAASLVVICRLGFQIEKYGIDIGKKIVSKQSTHSSPLKLAS